MHGLIITFSSVLIGSLPPLKGLNFDAEDWRDTVRMAIATTRDAFGDRLPITALVDKKTFRSEKKCVVVACMLFIVSFKALFITDFFFLLVEYTSLSC